MPSDTRSLRVPKYRRHKPSGQAVVTIAGKDHYLGKWNTKASRGEYDRLIREWLAAGRCLPKSETGPSVAELVLAYWRHAKSYYVTKTGKPSGSIDRIRVALRALRESYGPTPAHEFGPLALQAIRQKLIESGKSRRYINYLIDSIRRVFKWGVSQEFVPEPVYRALQTVTGLRKDRSPAPEPEPIGPVSDDVVDATLPYLGEVVADMVRLERLTGCRPGEVCAMRPMDVDRSQEVWLYRPGSHKTEHHGRGRVIAIGPKGQDVLRSHLLRDPKSCCFVPAESEKRRLRDMRARRKSKVQPSQRSRRKRNPKRKPGESYTTAAYRRAVHRAVEAANRDRKKRELPLLPMWSPNRLRHSAATQIRKEFDLESARTVLGHSTVSITEIYAEQDLALAAKVAQKIG